MSTRRCLPWSYILLFAAQAYTDSIISEISLIWSHWIPLCWTSLRTAGTNLFLVGCNYAGAFWDAGKTNKRGMKPDGDEIPLYCMILVGLVMWQHIWMCPLVSHSSCRYLPNQAAGHIVVFVAATVLDAAAQTHRLPLCQRTLSVSLGQSQARLSVKGRAIHPSIMLSDGGWPRGAGPTCLMYYRHFTDSR